jgi:hypothetical protein
VHAVDDARRRMIEIATSCTTSRLGVWHVIIHPLPTLRARCPDMEKAESTSDRPTNNMTPITIVRAERPPEAA